MLTDMHRLMGTHACAHIYSCVHLFTQFMTPIGPPVEGGQWLGLREREVAAMQESAQQSVVRRYERRV